MKISFQICLQQKKVLELASKYDFKGRQDSNLQKNDEIEKAVPVREEVTAKKLWRLFLIFFKIGSFTFGGGLAMLPQIQHEIVDRYKLLTEEEIVDVFAISQSVPGVIALNASVFIGKKSYGIRGAIVAALGSTIPSFIAIMLYVTVLGFVQDNIYVQKAFLGVRAACTALILVAGLKLWPLAVKRPTSVVLATASLILVGLLGVYVIWVILLAFSLTMTSYFLRKKNIFGIIASFIFTPGLIVYIFLTMQAGFGFAIIAYVVFFMAAHFFEGRALKNA
jgi:chromate transporter